MCVVKLSILHNVNYSTKKNAYNSVYRLLFTRLLFMCIIFFNSNYYAHSQNASDSLLIQYKKNELLKIDSLVNSYQEKSNFRWLNLLTNVNYHYNPVTAQNYVSIGISLNSYANYYQQKQRNKIELLKVENALKEKLDNNLVRLENEYLKILAEIDLIKLSVDNFMLNRELLQLYNEQYKNNKINLEKWLIHKQNYENKRAVIINKINALIIKIKHFYSKTKNSSTAVLELNILRALKGSLKHKQL